MPEQRTVQHENLCLTSIQHRLIKVAYAHRLSKRMRPMGLVCVCECTERKRENGGKKIEISPQRASVI